MNRSELAAALKRHRSRISPEDVGLPSHRRRRVPGLRREEVAQLAGVSADYVVRLEQARGPRPSEQVLSALARALRLDRDQVDELFQLAGRAPPRPGRVDELVRPSVQRLIDRLADLPVMVISGKGDLLAWNAPAAALLGDWSEVPYRERNIIWQRFLGDPARARVAASAEERAMTAAQSVGSLRAAAARYPDDPGVQSLVTELRTRSAEFERLWQSGAGGPWRIDRKTVDHPVVGRLTLDCDHLVLPDTDQVVIVYSAEPGTPEAEALSLLRVIGTERFDTGRIDTGRIDTERFDTGRIDTGAEPGRQNPAGS